MHNKISPVVEPESGYPELPRFIIAGSDESGKSTLTSRLLAECRLAAITGGRFIVSDTPDHADYTDYAGHADQTDQTDQADYAGHADQTDCTDQTDHTDQTDCTDQTDHPDPNYLPVLPEQARYLFTGAASPDAIILVADAGKGLTEQIKRHSYLASLRRIPYVILAINKMDLVGFSEAIYNNIKKEYGEIGSLLGISNIFYIPISAQNGDNVTNSSVNTSWYGGNTLLEILETIPVPHIGMDLPARFPIGHVIRSQDENPYESSAFAGRLSSGRLKVGDSLLVIPGNRVASIKTIYEGDKQLQQANTPQSIVIQLTNNLPVDRGSMFVKLNEKFPKYSSKVTLIVYWLNKKALKTGVRYIVRHTTDETAAVVESIRYKVNIHTLDNSTEDKNVAFNDIAHITIKAEKPLKYDDYSENRTTGSLLLIDEFTFETVGAGMIVSDPEVYSYNI